MVGEENDYWAELALLVIYRHQVVAIVEGIHSHAHHHMIKAGGGWLIPYIYISYIHEYRDI
jgi:hypothetical protein